MASATGSTYTILSDHPSDESRIKNIQGWLPEAKQYYKPTTTTKSSTSSKTKSSSSSTTSTSYKSSSGSKTTTRTLKISSKK